MNVVKMTKRTAGKYEQAQLIVSLYCLLSGIKLSNTERDVLAYFMIYRITETTKELIFKSGLITAEQSYNNIISKLKRNNLIKKDEIKREYYINVDVLKTVEPTIGMIIKTETMDSNDPAIGIILKIDNK